jgi:hypothetical protein
MTYDIFRSIQRIIANGLRSYQQYSLRQIRDLFLPIRQWFLDAYISLSLFFGILQFIFQRNLRT